MFRRRKKKNKAVQETQPELSPPVQTPKTDPSSQPSIPTYQETKTSPLLTDAFQEAFEKVVERLKSKLISEGKIEPMVFFVEKDGSMKTAVLSVKDDFQKEELVRRIREKTLAEDISTVITLTAVGDGDRVVLSGVNPNASGSALIDYSFDNATRAITSWKMNRLAQPLKNIFLDGIFDKKK